MAKRGIGPLESVAERKAVKMMEELGWKNYKLNGLGKASKPDRLFIGKNCHVFVEFKRENELPTVLQADELTELFMNGHSVAVCVHSKDLKQVLMAMRELKEKRKADLPVFWRYWLHRGFGYPT